MDNSGACPNPQASADLDLDCSFYPDCLEGAVKCGADGYALGYGGKYCNRFKDNISYFSADGQRWIHGTLKCLKNHLVKVASGSGPKDCKGIMDLAFDSHVPCYVDNGFCSLAFHWTNPAEEFHFLRALMRVYDVKDFASLMAIKQVGGVLKSCTFGNDVAS